MVITQLINVVIATKTDANCVWKTSVAIATAVMTVASANVVFATAKIG
jgi:hypothetical protein